MSTRVRIAQAITRSSRRTVTTLALAGAALGLTLTGSAVAGGYQAVPPPPTSPTSADQIQNIDQVRTAIKGYYGDTTTNVVDPVSSRTRPRTWPRRPSTTTSPGRRPCCSTWTTPR